MKLEIGDLLKRLSVKYQNKFYFNNRTYDFFDIRIINYDVSDKLIYYLKKFGYNDNFTNKLKTIIENFYKNNKNKLAEDYPIILRLYPHHNIITVIPTVNKEDKNIIYCSDYTFLNFSKHIDDIENINKDVLK